MQRELLDGLQRSGFRTNLGEDNSGVHMLYIRRGGGFYFSKNPLLSLSGLLRLPTSIQDTGASDLIINGTIKLKNDRRRHKAEQGRRLGKCKLVEAEMGTPLGDVAIIAQEWDEAIEVVGW